jgi:ribosome-binding factor A
LAKFRTGRVGEEIKRELSALIQNELKDPRVGFITITAVDVSGDLSQAKVYISLMGTDEEKAQSLKTLERAKGFLRSQLGQRIRLRRTPELIFKYDHSLDYGHQIDRLLQEIHQKDGGQK